MKKQKVAVTVGRFQVADLHYAQIFILYNLMKTNDRLCVLLGCSSATGTSRDPLDFESRKKMLEKQFPDIIIDRIDDNISDEVWSENVDKKIKQLFSDKSNVTLYGGRDSFLQHYQGKYPTKEFKKINHFPGTVVREKIGATVKDSAEWREGQIYLSQNQYPRLFMTVDIAVLKQSDDKNLQVLLGKKSGEKKLRFVGGFVDATDSCLEEACKREVIEETSLEVDDFEYVSSRLIDDWRYKQTKDRIMTSFFVCKYIYGSTFQAKDDIAELDWYDINKIKFNMINDSHQNLYLDLMKYLSNKLTLPLKNDKLNLTMFD
jgi:bifunctional NMN adenylyltransferase/nudix hydrolase